MVILVHICVYCFFFWSFLIGSEASLGRKLFKADDPNVVERWLRHGADVWQRDSAGNVPLHVASKEVAAWKSENLRKFGELQNKA